MTKALSGNSEAGRLYTIRWLRVLARIRATNFAQYGIELLVDQLRDNSMQVNWTLILITLLPFSTYCKYIHLDTVQ